MYHGVMVHVFTWLEAVMPCWIMINAHQHSNEPLCIHNLTFDLPPAQICAHGIIPHISTGADLHPHAHVTTMPHLFWPRSGFPRFPGLVLVSTDSEWAGLPSWKVAWSYVLNFSSYSRSKLINFSVDSSGIFQRSSHLNTYRNEAFKDIFTCSSHSLWIWVIWRLFGGLNHQPAQFKMNWRRIHHSATSAKKVLQHIFSYQFD